MTLRWQLVSMKQRLTVPAEEVDNNVLGKKRWRDVRYITVLPRFQLFSIQFQKSNISNFLELRLNFLHHFLT
jgi:hypothetical protein